MKLSTKIKGNRADYGLSRECRGSRRLGNNFTERRRLCRPAEEALEHERVALDGAPRSGPAFLLWTKAMRERPPSFGRIRVECELVSLRTTRTSS